MHSMFFSLKAFSDLIVDSLLDWSLTLPRGWGYSVSGLGSHDSKIELCPPFGFEAAPFKGSEPLFVSRTFEGYSRDKAHYFEFSPRFIQSEDLHWVEDRNSYCKINEVGDLEEVIYVKRQAPGFVLIRNRELHSFLGAGNQLLGRVFDIHRAFDWISLGRDGRREEQKIIGVGLAYKSLSIFSEKNPGELSAQYFRGGSLTKCPHSKEELLKITGLGFEEPEREYASMIVWDWKNQSLLEDYSLEPTNFANYFTDSKKPYETSPCFFNSEVLRKYKDDPEKYTLDPRALDCRGAWYLNSYDINEAGQVHAYVCDLRHLPFKEQLHWKQFNEAPKSGLSKRAIATDFEAKFPEHNDPLYVLGNEIRKLAQFVISGSCEPLWKPKCGRLEDVMNGIYYMTTESKKEWDDFNLALTVAINDGFQLNALASLSKTLGCFDSEMKSLGLLRACLLKTGSDPELVVQAIKPLRDLQQDRSKGGAHGGGSRPNGSLKALAKQRIDDLVLGLQTLHRLSQQ